jgi:hypothetical protein
MLLLGLAPLVAGCGPLQSAGAFATEIARKFPPGSDAADLRQNLTRRGFAEGRPFGPPIDLLHCLKRSVSNWPFTGGDRYVCFATSADGTLTDVRSNEFVMSP